MADNTKVKIATHPGVHGDHPVGGAVGAAVGALAGAAAVGAAQGAAFGAIAGVPGMAAGIAVGGVIGALAGKAAAQEINPTVEDAYWNVNYTTRPYVDENQTYDYYGPAYRHGIDAFTKYEGDRFEKVEPKLANEWEQVRGDSKLSWEKAKPAARDAYDRLYNRKNEA